MYGLCNMTALMVHKAVNQTACESYPSPPLLLSTTFRIVIGR